MNATVADFETLRAAAAARFAAAGLCGAGPVSRAPPTGALCPDRYLGRFDKCGTPALNGAQATYDGTLATALLDRELVSAILPPLARLAEPQQSTWTLHPVLCLMGRQNEPRELSNGNAVAIPLAKPYNELIVLIPYVVCLGQARWHSFSARMYLDDLGATIIGNLDYAYAKLLGEFELTASSAQVISGGDTVFEIDSAAQDDDDESSPPDDNWMSDAYAQTNLLGYGDMRRILEMPIVGYSGLYGYRRSYFEWNYDNAQVSATRCLLRFCRPLRAGMQAWCELGLLQSAPQAAFKVRKVRWRLSLQFPAQNFGG